MPLPLIHPLSEIDSSSILIFYIEKWFFFFFDTLIVEMGELELWMFSLKKLRSVS